jgi:HEPN domain-containing protein
VTPQGQTTPVDRSRAWAFLAKAEEFLRSAKRTLQEGDHSAAGVLAIHAGISACDSITVWHLGRRSSSQRHLDVLALLKGISFEGKEGVERQLRELLAEKREVEYEDRRLLSGDAEKMVKLAERIVKAAEQVQGKR